MNPRRDHLARMVALLALALAQQAGGWHWGFWGFSLLMAGISGGLDLASRKDYDR